MINSPAKRICRFFLLLIAAIICTPSIAIEENTMVTVTRIQIDIDRPANVVWPYVMDFTKWSDNQLVEQLSGTPNTVGSILRRTITRGEYQQVRTEEVLFIEPEKRMVLRVHPEPNPTNMMVTVNIELLPNGKNGSIFQLDVYMKDEAPGESPLPRDQLINQQTQIGTNMAEPLVQGYTRLKAAVEAETQANSGPDL